MSISYKQIKYEVHKGLKRALGLRDLPPEYPLDFIPEAVALCKKVKPYTMTSNERISALRDAIVYIEKHQIPGDMVECGVALGGSSLAIAETLISLGNLNRTIWLYDTFEGMPEPTKEDVGIFNNPAMKNYKRRQNDSGSTWINHSMEAVKQTMALSSYPENKITYVKGLVEETLQRQCPETISLLRLDTDFYNSTKMEMELLFPKLATGGIVIADDYYRWLGSRKAIDEYTDSRNIQIFWNRIDDHSALAVKMPETNRPADS